MYSWSSQIFRQVFIGVWSTNWPLVVLPLIACLSAERLSSRLSRIPIGNNKKYVLAILLSSLPGLVFLSLGAYALIAFRHAEVDSALCVMVFVAPLAIFSIGICRAVLAWRSQHHLVQQLLRKTRAATGSTRQLAAKLDLTVRILPTEYLACMTVGITRPTVVLSAGAVDQLSLEELNAVLVHEQIHVKRKDTLLATLGTLVAACAFSRPTNTDALARRAREIRADEETSKTVDRLLLASVLIKFARRPPLESYAFAQSFACPSAVSERVEHLLSSSTTQHGRGMRRMEVLIALTFLLVFYPYIVRLVAAIWLHC